MTASLKNQAAMVTGTSRGIGRSIALALAGEGVSVGFIARTEPELTSLKQEIESSGGKAVFQVCDLADTDSISPAYRELVSQLGGLDILVNNAAVFVEKPVDDLDTDTWERVMRVNLTAPFTLSKLAVEDMKSRSGGRIVNIASTASRQGYLHQSSYVASKHGLLGFARSLAMEVKKHNIHVHTLCPGGVDTDFIKGTYLADRLEGQVMINPDDVAATVVHLLKQPGNIDMPEIVMRRFDPNS